MLPLTNMRFPGADPMRFQPYPVQPIRPIGPAQSAPIQGGQPPIAGPIGPYPVSPIRPMPAPAGPAPYQPIGAQGPMQGQPPQIDPEMLQRLMQFRQMMMQPGRMSF